MEFGENTVYKSGSRIKEGYIKSVVYDHTDKIEIRNETRKKALLEASKKAKALAGTLGSEIGEPLVIKENPSFDGGPRPQYAANMRAEMDSFGGGGGPVLALGKIPIRTTVQVVFRLITTD